MTSEPEPKPPSTAPALAPTSEAPSSQSAREQGLRATLKMWRAWLRSILELLASLFSSNRRRKARAARPWHLHVAAKKVRASLDPKQIDRLLQRHQGLQDMEKLAQISAQFRLPESDFFADPRQIERLIRRFLEENPPWLHISRVLSGGDQGAETHSPEFLWREQEVRAVEDVTLHIPDDSWRDRPLASLTMRPARHLSEVWQARLLDQILPPEVLLDRMNRGEVLIPVHKPQKQRLEFRTEIRRMEITTRKPIPIPIETEGGSGKGGQLLYILLDYSASMRGKSATLALAVIAATLRAHLGQRETRYLFRRYAELSELWPPAVERALEARTLQEKDAFLDTIFATNFNGTATNINDALTVAVTDIENLRRQESLEAGMLLVTDGRAEILEGTRLSLVRAQVKVHTVMVTAESNPSLEAISESFTALNIGPDELVAKDRAKGGASDANSGGAPVFPGLTESHRKS